MILQRVLETTGKVDVDLSYKLYSSVPHTKKVQQILHGLEWSCHGIPWLAGVMTLIYVYPDKTSFQYLLVGLVMDLVYVALLKAYARRRRPGFARQDDQMVVVSVDKHSFPSGHASRAVYFACFCCDQSILSFAVWVWAVAVVLSRVLLGRHHIGKLTAARAFVIYSRTSLFYRRRNCRLHSRRAGVRRAVQHRLAGEQHYAVAYLK